MRQDSCHFPLYCGKGKYWGVTEGPQGEPRVDVLREGKGNLQEASEEVGEEDRENGDPGELQEKWHLPWRPGGQTLGLVELGS